MTKDGGRLQFYAAIYFHATTCCLSDYWLPPEQDRRKKHMSVNRDPLEIAYFPSDTSLVASWRLFRLTASRIGCPYYKCEDLSLENPCFSSLTSHNDFHSKSHQMSSWPSVLSPAWALMGVSCSTVFSHNALPGSSCQGRRYFLSQRLSLHYCFKELLTDVLSMDLSEVWFLSQSQNLLYQWGLQFNYVFCEKVLSLFLNLLSDNCIGYTFVLYLEAGYSSKIDFNGIQREVNFTMLIQLHV